jgi:hypothetical protein
MNMDSIIDRAIDAATCVCRGTCLCHHPNPVVAEKVKSSGDCVCNQQEKK